MARLEGVEDVRDRTSSPASPAAGLLRRFVKNGWPYFKNSAGVEVGLMGKSLSFPSILYVDRNGNDTTGDGASPGSAFRQINPAIAALSGAAGIIYVSSGIFAPFTAANGVTIIGVSQGVAGNGTYIQPTSSSGSAVTVHTTNCHLVNICARNTTLPIYTGKFFDIDNATASTFRSCIAANLGAGGTYNATQSGTGWSISNTEGGYWEHCAANNTSLAWDLPFEASTNTFINCTGAINWKILDMTVQSGGNRFIRFKYTGCGDPSLPGPSGSNVFNLAGGNNVFIGLDINEAGATTGTISGDENTFIDTTWAPGHLMTLSGDRNLFLQGRTLGAFTVTGDNNTLEHWRALGTTIVNGSNNVVENEWGTITGTGIIRRVYGSVPRVEATQWKPGREWFTDFTSATADAFLFDLTGFTYTTDGGSPAIHLTAAATQGTLFTKEQLRDCEVLVRFRLVPEGVYAITNVTMAPVARHLDANNMWTCYASPAAGNNQLSGQSIANSVIAGTAGSGVGTFNNADSTTYRYMRMRVLGDTIHAKWWFVNAAEPAAWQIIQRLRQPTFGASPNASADNVEVGTAGFTLQYGGMVQSIKVTELIRGDSNLIVNPSPTVIETGGDLFPVPWVRTADTGSDVRSIVSIADRFGETRPVFKLHKVSTSVNLLWVQDIYRGGSAHMNLTRKMPWPRANFPQAIEVSLWSKGTSVVVPGGIGAVIDIYTYDDIPNTLYTSSTYHATLGPNGAPLEAGGKKGDGTWDWYETRYRMHLDNWERITRMLVQIGFHDGSSTGDLWFTDVRLTPCD